MTVSTSTPIKSLTNRLSASEQDTLCRKQPVVTGQQGEYVGWILADADLETAWEVLTDYNHFSQFLPTVASSRVLEVNGNRKVVEQVDRRRVLFMDLTSTVQTENVEQAPDRIDFRLIDGNLKTLQGKWQVFPADVKNLNVKTSGIKTSDSPQVLIMQTVKAEADAGFLEGMFYQVFEASLKENLIALQQESERR
jgi:ribosome-associated toxin RatA of RatAB toxin-antitoxin module